MDKLLSDYETVIYEIKGLIMQNKYKKALKLLKKLQKQDFFSKPVEVVATRPLRRKFRRIVDDSHILHEAVKRNLNDETKEIIKILKKLGASVLTKNEDGLTPARVAIRSFAQPDILSELLDRYSLSYTAIDANRENILHDIIFQLNNVEIESYGDFYGQTLGEEGTKDIKKVKIDNYIDEIMLKNALTVLTHQDLEKTKLLKQKNLVKQTPQSMANTLTRIFIEGLGNRK